jgi:sugar phosphate isomerase/epimerase
MQRRSFIQNVCLATGGMLLPSVLGCKTTTRTSMKGIGIQLYTLRDEIMTDMEGVLKLIASIGYTELESYNYEDGKIFKRPFNDFVKAAEVWGLKIVSGHYKTGYKSTVPGNLRNNWEMAVADAKAAGQSYMVIPSMTREERSSMDQLKEFCELMNRGGELCKQYGIRLGYHNHDFEFQEVGGQLIYDILLAELDPALVCMELDIYWITRAGYSPAVYFNRYPGRFELWHVKDMSKDDPQKNTDIGTGTIDFKELFKMAELSGMKHFFVEQETYEISPQVSIENAMQNLTRILS